MLLMSKVVDKKGAEDAISQLLRYIGEDPSREGLQDTPSRVIRSYQEFFWGYQQDPAEPLKKTFKFEKDYNEIVIVKDINVFSHCEHHMVPIIGVAHVAYIPNKRIVGLSKLARVVNIFSRRLQTQERLTLEIAETIHENLEPKGVAVMINAVHQCMTSRGVKNVDSSTITSHYNGLFAKDIKVRQEFLELTRTI